MAALPGQSADHQRYMRMALRLARRGLGRSSPNPAVGAVVVKNGRVVGRGFHAQAGTPHAEIHALAQAGGQAKGADIYVTLEPCNHHGRTPPCTRAIQEAGIRRVFFGAADPNPKAQGGGDYLQQQGLKVYGGVLGQRCEHEHRFFLTHVTLGRPHVILKTAATADGRIATHSGHSRWVTGEASRQQVHRLRNWCDAICVGIGTALADDPELTCRLRGGRDPLRVVVDSKLRLPPEAKVLAADDQAGCVVACAKGAPTGRARALQQAGAEVLVLGQGPGGGVDLAELLAELGRRGITSLLLEGGAGLAWGFLSQGLVDEVMYFHAPKLIGGAGAPGMIGGAGFAFMDQAVMLHKLRIRRFGDDILLQARVRRD